MNVDWDVDSYFDSFVMVVSYSSFPGKFMLMWMIFDCKYSFRPSCPPSRPNPDSFHPPKLVCNELVMAALMRMIPTSSCPAIRKARTISDVKILAGVELARTG